MSSNKSPFEILGISPAAELIVVNAAYKALARKYHPDMNPQISATELNRKMSEINWAKEELERDLEGWRRRVEFASTNTTQQEGARFNTTHTGTPNTGVWQPTRPSRQLQIEPQIIFLAGHRGSTATFAVVADSVPPAAIRARFKPGSIEVERLPSTRATAQFKVTVVEDFSSDVPDNDIETIEIRAPGFAHNTVFASIAPISSAVLSQQYGGRIAPPRHASYEARISFGKHRGRPFREIAIEEPGYLEWMLREGAGSRVERECARLALEFVRGGASLRRASQSHSAVKQPQSFSHPPILPDPNRPRGLFGALKTLFSPSERRS